MSVAPISTHDPLAGRAAARVARIMGSRVRRVPSPRRLARRRWFVNTAKLVLPLLAMCLLASMMFWHELFTDAGSARFSYRRGVLEAVSGQIRDPRYHGIDEHNRPYTVTAASARQVGPEKFDLVEPKADMTMENGTWMMVQSHKGVFIQHSNIIDLFDDVTLYRDDGTTMITSAATVDTKAGAATSAQMVHVEGPFGTLDAQGFATADSGAVTQFTGPGHLVLNGGRK